MSIVRRVEQEQETNNDNIVNDKRVEVVPPWSHRHDALHISSGYEAFEPKWKQRKRASE